MSGDNEEKRVEIKYIFVGVLCWFAAAPLSVMLAALMLNRDGITMQSVAYASSAVSFAAAAIAAAAAQRVRKHSRFMTGLTTGAVLTVLLLMIGFMVKGEGIEASAVISVAAFSISGALAGAVFVPLGKSRGKRGIGTKKLT